MQIDWVTVAAQIVNFLILVALLKHFLYGPIINAMDRRERRIAKRLHDADEREQEAGKEAERHRRQSEQLEQEKQQLLNQAREEADQERDRLLNQARQHVEQKRQEWEKGLEREQNDFMKGLRTQLAQEFQKLARQVLGDLADRQLEEAVIARFLDRLKSLDDDTLNQLRQEQGPLAVHTAFEADDSQQQRIREAVGDAISGDMNIRFHTDPQLLCGIELNSAGRKLAWTIDGYLEAVEHRMADALSAS